MKRLIFTAGTAMLIISVMAGSSIAEDESEGPVIHPKEQKYKNWVEAGENLIANGGFELDVNNDDIPDGWHKVGEEVVYDRTDNYAHSGEAACLMSSIQTFGFYEACSKLKPNTTYRYSAWIKPAESYWRVYLTISYFPGNPREGGILRSNDMSKAKGTEHTIEDNRLQTVVGGEWKQYVRFTTTPSFPVKTFVLSFQPVGKGSWLWVDDVSFIEVISPDEETKEKSSSDLYTHLDLDRPPCIDPHYTALK